MKILDNGDDNNNDNDDDYNRLDSFVNWYEKVKKIKNDTLLKSVHS